MLSTQKIQPELQPELQLRRKIGELQEPDQSNRTAQTKTSFLSCYLKLLTLTIHNKLRSAHSVVAS